MLTKFEAPSYNTFQVILILNFPTPNLKGQSFTKNKISIILLKNCTLTPKKGHYIAREDNSDKKKYRSTIF